MGLENLKSVFNDLTKNVKEDFGGPNGQGVHGGLTNESPSTPTHPTDHSIIANKFPNIATVAPDNESMSPTLSIGKSGIETRFATISKQGATPIKKEELSILDGLPNIARVSPDNQSMSPTLENGKGLPIGDSVFLDATGISRFSIGVDPVAKHPTDFSILDGLPNIARVKPDNESMSPTLNTGIGLISRHDNDDNHINVHSKLDDISNNLRKRQLARDNAPIKILKIDDSESVNYTPLVNDGIGINSGLQTFDGLLAGNIAKREFDISTLGKNSQLGEGDFTLGTLFKHNHRGSPERIQIDTGKKDHKGNAILINTGRAGIGSLGNLDIKGYSRNFRTGLIGDGEPYIVNDIGSSTNQVGNNRDLIPWRAALDDVSRLAQFYTSPAGVLFMAKENITNMLYGSTPNNALSRLINKPKGGELNIFDKILLPPVPVPNTGFLNFYQQKIQDVGPTIASLRKPFQTEYSKRPTKRLPFAFLGDEETNDLLFPIPGKYATLELKTPRFLGLGNGPRWRNNDKISDSGVEVDTTAVELAELFPDETAFHETLPPLETDIINPIQPGDFYVRIKDLRDGKFIYFRGYVTGITENVNPSFTPTNYIGRSEPVYSYERGERDLSFNLRVYPSNQPQFKNMYEKIERLTSLAYPEYLNIGNSERMKAPFTELYMAHIGTPVKGQFGFIKSISYTVPGEGDWDAKRALPRLFDISISYQILSKRPPGLGRGSSLHSNKFYGANI